MRGSIYNQRPHQIVPGKPQRWADYPAMMAGAVMAFLPLLVLIIVFQKQFIDGIAMSGIKG